MQRVSALRRLPSVRSMCNSASDGTPLTKPRLLRRFYKEVGVAPVEEGDGFGVMLDGRLLKTPAKAPLILPTEQIASGVALEWDSQTDYIVPATMPMMALTTTKTDRYPDIRERAVDGLVYHLGFDTTCFRESSEMLVKMQTDTWDPLHEWFADFLDIKLNTTDAFTLSHPDGSEAKLRAYLNELNDWELCAVDAVATDAKSIVVTLALKHGVVSINDALLAARLAENAQVEDWGYVEGGHDLADGAIGSKLAAASLLWRLLDR